MKEFSLLVGGLEQHVWFAEMHTQFYSKTFFFILEGVLLLYKVGENYNLASLW